MCHFRRVRGDSGAAAVEFALLFPIFMILALGILAAGTAFSRQINITQAAREASRYGATYDITAAGGIESWLDAVDGAVQQSAGNAANPIGGYNYRCVALVVTNTAGSVDTAQSRYTENGGATGNGSCPSTAAAAISAGKYVQVALSRESQFFVLFINPVLGLDAVSTTPYEGRLP